MAHPSVKGKKRKALNSKMSRVMRAHKRGGGKKKKHAKAKQVKSRKAKRHVKKRSRGY